LATIQSAPPSPQNHGLTITNSPRNHHLITKPTASLPSTPQPSFFPANQSQTHNKAITITTSPNHPSIQSLKPANTTKSVTTNQPSRALPQFIKPTPRPHLGWIPSFKLTPFTMTKPAITHGLITTTKSYNHQPVTIIKPPLYSAINQPQFTHPRPRHLQSRPHRSKTTARPHRFRLCTHCHRSKPLPELLCLSPSLASSRLNTAPAS
jgi:hypothetical protein